MKLRLNPLSSRRAFTLVELLVVMTIIASLAAIAIPVFGAVQRNARRQQTRTLAVQLDNSIQSFFTDYNRWPVPQGTTVTEATPLRTDEGLTGVLLGIDETANPRKTRYLSDVKDASDSRANGLITSGEQASLVDSFGEYFYIVMDGDYDEKIDNPNPAATSVKLFRNTAVWSAGPDKSTESWEDNIMSWTASQKSPSSSGQPQPGQ